MDAPAAKPRVAWQPLTPRGVAAFAYAKMGRVLVMELIVAFLAAATVIWFLLTAWFPVIARAVGQLPEVGEIRAGTLDWHGVSPVTLAENRFLAFTVDLTHEGKARSPAHIQVEFGKLDFQVFSLLGFVSSEYRREWVVPFNREELVPWWGAWKPPVLWMTAVSVIAGLMVVWIALATVYAIPVWLLGFFTDRALNLRGSWCLAGASLMPGALLLLGAIFLYGWDLFGLIELAIAAASHFVVGWVYLVVSTLRLPLQSVASGVKPNPFMTQPKSPGQAGEASRAKE
jgi:hypothetical protein